MEGEEIIRGSDFPAESAFLTLEGVQVWHCYVYSGQRFYEIHVVNPNLVEAIAQ